MNYSLIAVHMIQSEHNITDKFQWTHVGVLLDRGSGKAFQSAGIRSSSGFGSIQVRFRKSDQKHVFHPICVGIPRITHSSSARRSHRATQNKRAR